MLSIVPIPVQWLRAAVIEHPSHHPLLGLCDFSGDFSLIACGMRGGYTESPIDAFGPPATEAAQTHEYYAARPPELCTVNFVLCTQLADCHCPDGLSARLCCLSSDE